jgi:hypothetical protein
MNFVLFAFVLNLQMAEVTDLVPPQSFDTIEECSQALKELAPSVRYWRKRGYFDSGILCEPVRKEDIAMVKESLYEDLRELMNPFGRQR